VVSDECAEALGDTGQPEDGRGQSFYIDDLGSVSTISTVKAPSTMAFSLAFTFFTVSAGTLLAKVPNDASSGPLYFIVEYLPESSAFDFPFLSFLFSRLTVRSLF